MDRVSWEKRLALSRCNGQQTIADIRAETIRLSRCERHAPLYRLYRSLISNPSHQRKNKKATRGPVRPRMASLPIVIDQIRRRAEEGVSPARTTLAKQTIFYAAMLFASGILL
jgi:hypothetical protein